MMHLLRNRCCSSSAREESRLEYFNAAGWNENGVPKPETLRILGLEDAEAKLREVDLIK